MKVFLLFIIIAISWQVHGDAPPPSSVPSGQPSIAPTSQPSSTPSGQPSISPHSKPTGQPTSSPSGQPSKSPQSKPTSQPSSSPSAQPSMSPQSRPTSQPTCIPTSQPTSKPSVVPTAQPILYPTSKPSSQPSSNPSTKPSSQPSSSPSSLPSMQPTTQPSKQPVMMPTSIPSVQPSSSPTSRPTMQPSAQPSSVPSVQPSSQPSAQPIEYPTSRPTMQPSAQPSSVPSVQPSSQPSAQPIEYPTSRPSMQPSAQPSSVPSVQPSSQPSAQPIEYPTSRPSMQPSAQPSSLPTAQPQAFPTSLPTTQPTMQPSSQPSAAPTGDPTAQPSSAPSGQPSSFPSDAPSHQPTTQPSSVPTNQPSAMPSARPSTQPSNHPSAQPSAAPTSDPTAQPSESPSSQPSTQPSSSPSAQPSSFPSDVPSSEPSTQPSGQPTAQPTCEPSQQPTVSPSSQPSTQPSSSPSAQPSSFPSDIPSSEPSAQPSSQPTAQPTTQPSQQPLSRPTARPSSQPSSLPSSCPSSVPSSCPTSQPSSLPSAQPSALPSAQPSSVPSTQPSAQPTREPTAQPSCAPSAQPSTQPSSVPTGEPSAQPSSAPSVQPTASPSSLPTTQPTSQPSRQPFAYPTSQPTSSPTTVVSTRHYACNSKSVCEGQTATSCTYFTPSIVLTCVDEATPCYINTGTFSLGPDSTLLISGGCELKLNATKTVTVNTNSTLKGAAVSITLHGDMRVYGRITTTGFGPLGGPGAPLTLFPSQGGSYGGSGGNANCNLDYYSNNNHQIGSVDVQNDVSATSPNYYATFGSGGGFPNAGRGGGRIHLKSNGAVRVESGGLLDAMGSPANYTVLGAGSGGSIVITATSVNQLGVISVVGGPSQSNNGNYGAAGGGGRVTISIKTGTIESVITSQIYYRGGSVPLDAPNAPCLQGGSGTLYVQLRSSSGSTQGGVVQVSNNDMNTYAATMLHTLPAKTSGVWVIDRAVVSSNSTMALKELSSCTRAALGTTACSAIRFNNAELVTLRNSTDVRHPYTCTIGADEVHFVGSQVTGVRLTDYSVNIASKYFELTTNSSVSYSAELRILATYEANIYGAVTQRPSGMNPATGKAFFTPISLMRVIVGGNLTISNVSASNLLLDANRVTLPAHSLISKTADTVVASCVKNISQTNFHCSDYEYTETLRYNHTYVIIGNQSITMAEHARVEAAQILLCAPTIEIENGTDVSASSRGCTANKGPGAGGMQSSLTADYPNGGGGAGYGGVGGYGYALHNNGVAYYSTRNLSSGSGGGCFDCEGVPFSSAGGGVINIVASRFLDMNGNISANGGAGVGGSGGGSGGTVAVNAVSMAGKGRISASGGNGGDGSYPGGGGGGGVVALFNELQSFEYFTFTGFVDVNGGNPGGQPPASKMSFTSSADGSMLVGTVATRNDTFPIPLLPQLRKSAPAERALWALQAASPSPASGGQSGKTFLPTCDAGTGNDAVTGAVCEPCPVGTYGPGSTSKPCIPCDNAPLHSHYTDESVSTSQCPYQCDSGFVTEDCYNQIQNLIYNVMGVPAFAGMCVGIFLILMVPLGYTRLKRRYGWFTYFDRKKQKRRDIFAIDFFARNSADDDSGIMDSSGGKAEAAIKMQKFTTDNPVLRSASQDTNEPERDAEVMSGIRTLRNNLFAERRREHRMNDQDLVYHAYRINLFGSNHPMRSKGGPWKFPSSRPACLRPMLRRTEFQALATKINQLTEWHLFSFEMLAFYFVGIVAAPLAAYLMKHFRRRRANALLKAIAHYDYSCFRCPKQRTTQNSLRIGISPDYTLAYIDFLFDEEHFRSRVKPLCPLGQVRLPATFKVAGLGTYCSPYFIDTNDLILQAVPQTDIPSSFINDAWIRFVVDLNTILRTVQSDSVHLGVYKLVKFLSDDQHSVSLGGLVVEFCTFSNNEKVYESERKRRERELLEEAYQKQDQFGEDSSVGATAGTKSERTLNSAETQANVDRFSLDSFGFATGGRKSDDGGNWFANFLDVTSPWSKTAGTGATAKLNKPVELEMRASSFRGPPPESLNSIITRESSNNNVSASASAPAAQATYERSFLGRLCTFFEGIFKSICDKIADFTSSGYKPDDPAGKNLTFHEMCNAIQEGNLTMGIIVTHSKVAANDYILQDDDYDSEEEEFYEEDVPNTPILRNPKRLETLRESDEEDSDTAAALSDDDSGGGEASGAETEGESSSNISPLRTISNATDMSVSLHKVYGDKADEMQKFYNIMMSAEAQQAQQQTQQQAQRPVSTPEVLSNRKRASVPTAPTATASPSATRTSAERKRTSSKESPTSQSSSKSDRRRQASSSQSARSTPSVGGEPRADSRAGSRDRRSPTPSQGVEDKKAEATNKDIDVEDFDIDVDTSGYAYPGRQTYGEFDFADALEMEPPPLQIPDSDRHTFASESFVTPPAQSSPTQTIAKTSTTGFRHSTGSDDSEQEKEFPPAAAPKTANFRRSTRSSESESGDETSSAAAAPAAGKSKPSSGFRYSAGSEGSDDENAPQQDMTAASKAASEFRHSGDSRGSEASSEPSAMPTEAFSTDDDRLVPPVAAAASSPSKASPKLSPREEYTEFRPADRGRKLTESSTGFDDTLRFSEFRHSNAYDDRVSDFGYDEGTVSVHQQQSRYRDSEASEEGDAPQPSQYAINMSRYQSTDSVAQDRSIVARSIRAPTERSVSKESERSRIKSTTQRTSRRPYSKGKPQKDLSRVNLAPSAHQQEFSAWRLVKDATVPVSGEPVTTLPSAGNAATAFTLGGGVLYGSNPMHGRESMTVDRSSMITADERAVDADLYAAEEGGLGGALELTNPMRYTVRPRSVNPISPVNVSNRSRIASWSKEKSREIEMRDSDVDSDVPQVDPKDRLRSGLDTSGFAFETASRPSDAATVHNDSHQLAEQASSTIKEGFKAIYSARVIFLFLSRFMFGGNVYPVGRSYVRRVLEFLIFMLSIGDMVLGSTICFEFYCVSGDYTKCKDHTFLYLILSVFPLAIVIAPLLGVTAVMLGPTATLSRIYAMWCRLAGVNNFIMLGVYVSYFSFFANAALSTYPVILYTCSRALQCLIIDQYIAHIEKLRYTRGWDGLSTSLFKTQDNKTFIS